MKLNLNNKNSPDKDNERMNELFNSKTNTEENILNMLSNSADKLKPTPNPGEAKDRLQTLKGERLQKPRNLEINDNLSAGNKLMKPPEGLSETKALKLNLGGVKSGVVSKEDMITESSLKEMAAIKDKVAEPIQDPVKVNPVSFDPIEVDLNKPEGISEIPSGVEEFSYPDAGEAAVKPKKKGFLGFGSKEKKPKAPKPPKKQKAPKKAKEIKLEDDKIGEIDTSIDSDDMITKQYNRMKMKRAVTTVLILGFMASMVIFGTYNTFIKQDKSVRQIASEVNNVNMTTPFPDYGVDGFLKQNIMELSKDVLRKGKEVGELTMPPDKIYITSIIKKTAYIANVYFTAEIRTDKGASMHNFFIPINYSYDENSYNPAGELQLTPVQPKNSVKKENNDVLTFKGISKSGEDKTKAVGTFIENFLMMVYNEDVDVSPYYKGSDILGDPNAKFIKVNTFELYEGLNKNNFNGIVEYTLMLNNGAEYRVKNYVNVEPSGDSSYVINSIL